MSVAIAGVDPLVVSGWAAVSPLGMDDAAFAEGVLAVTSGVRPVEQGLGVPQQRAALIADFDQRTALGRKGTRSMDRVTGLAVHVVGRLLSMAPRNVVTGEGYDVGLVLGTGTGSVRSMMEFTQSSLEGAKPYDVDPARFPNTVMNCAAGQCAIWYGLRGPNTTVAGGQVTGLLAMRYAARLLRNGHASTVLCGAAEEFSTQRSWLEWHATAGDHAPLGEGAAIFLLEPATVAAASGRQPLADLVAMEFGVANDETDVTTVLARCVLRALRGCGASPAAIWAYAPGPYDARRADLAVSVPGTPRHRSNPAELVGDTGAVSAAFQLAAVLALAERDAPPRGALALITSIDRDGLVGAALFGLRDPGPQTPRKAVVR